MERWLVLIGILDKCKIHCGFQKVSDKKRIEYFSFTVMKC